MPDPNLINRRCIALLRCSTQGQKKDSIPQQAAWLRDFSDENQIVYVGEIQEALGVSQTQKRPDIEYLLRRKRNTDDFDTVLVQDLSRLTRGGLEHGLKLYFEFKTVGLQILSIVDGLIDGEEKLKEAIRRFEADRAATKATALLTVRGKIRNRKNGRCLYTSRVPFGIDRMYLSTDGVPLHIIRNLTDGTQQQLNVAGDQVLRTFDKNENGEWRHYTKQPNEYSKFVLGAPERVAIIRKIYRQFFIENIGVTQITRELNDAKIPAPQGGRWATAAVVLMLRSSIYLGRGIANRISRAIFYMTGTNTPQPVASSKNPQAFSNGNDSKQKTLLRNYRPKEEWFEQIFVELENFLDLNEEVREKIWKYQLKHHHRLAARISTKPGGGDRYPDSEYILKGVLRSKQGNRPMTGCKTKNRNRTKYTYYRVSEGRTAPKDNDVFSKLVPAQMLEDAALDVLKQAMSSCGDIHPTVMAVLEEDEKSLSSDRDELPNLQRERRATEDIIDFYVNDMAMLGSDALRRKTEPLRLKLLDLNQRIETAERAVVKKPNVRVVAQMVEQKCREVAASLEGMSRIQKRWLVQSLVSKMEVDLETRETTMEVCMPSWALTGNATDSVCAVPISDYRTFKGANTEWAIPLGVFHCVQHIVKRHACMRCSRALPVSTEAQQSRLIAA